MKVTASYRQLIAEALRDVRQSSGLKNPNDAESASASTILLVNSLLEMGIELGASDIHLEPLSDRLRARFRIDGILVEDDARIPLMLALPIISRLKVMAGMDIAKRNLPQDGQLSYYKNGLRVDIRVAALPVIGGERLVLRLLAGEDSFLSIKDLGFCDEKLRVFQRLIRRPTGLLLLCGPMNSGKTTTLYAALAELNTPEHNIVTLEDPVERRLEGINQLTINPKAGLSYLTGLRAVLRQDAQKILLGEIRDKETAEMAVRIALTGHALFSTLHTDNSVSAVFRMLEMGVPSYLLAATLSGVIAQRLVRRICSHCKEEYKPGEHDPEFMVLQDSLEGKLSFRNITLAIGRGCPKCQGTGYKGLMAVQEMLVVNEDIREAIIHSRRQSELRAVADANGTETLWQDAVSKVLAKETTLAEIGRVIYGSDNV